MLWLVSSSIITNAWALVVYTVKIRVLLQHPIKIEICVGCYNSTEGCRMELLQHPKGVTLHSTPIKVLN